MAEAYQRVSVRKNVVERPWKVLDHEGLRVIGVGEARFGKLLEMLNRYKYMERTQGLQVRVADDQRMPTCRAEQKPSGRQEQNLIQ